MELKTGAIQERVGDAKEDEDEDDDGYYSLTEDSKEETL
jgi:hypothetical protein